MWARTFDSMERAIQEGRIGFSLQTIASVAQEGDPLYAECLGRIIRSDGVVLTADELLENPGVIESIAAFDRHMIVLAFEWLALLPAGNLGCGISTSMLSNERDRHAVLDILIANQVMAGRLVLELKFEDAEFSIGMVRDFCEAVRKLGYRVALDGFGTGHTTPEMLFALPFDIVKIDAFSFAATGGKARQVLFHMANLAACATPIVVLKGVETYEQLEAARAIGVTHVQGFLLSEPTLAPEFASGVPLALVLQGQRDTLH
jgi:EAL domain-containing protein (putative c-di-GMP-specific phosphodiesterase class I)